MGYEAEIPARPGYIMKVRRARSAHVWTGNDTLCRMWSTGGLKKSGYVYSSEDTGLPTCYMCDTNKKSRCVQIPSQSKRKPWVYIASAYTKGDTGINVRFQMTVWNLLLEMGCIPIAPLWSHFQHLHIPRPYQDWVDYDNEIIRKCDVLIRLTARERVGSEIYEQADSSGADQEVGLALSLGIPVVYSVAELLAYVRRSNERSN